MRAILFSFFLVPFFSCEDSEGEKISDPRDQLVGTYQCMITQFDGKGKFLLQSGNVIRNIKKSIKPSVIDLIQGGEVFCSIEIEPASDGFLLNIIPGQINWSGSSEGYSIVGDFDKGDPSFYEVKDGHFWIYYTILYFDTPVRFVVLDGIKM